MGCSSSRESRGGAVSPAPAERLQGLRSLSTRAASALTSLGFCRAGHDVVRAYAPLPPCDEEAKGAGDPEAADEALPGDGAAAEEEEQRRLDAPSSPAALSLPPALDLDPATLPGILRAAQVVPSPSHPALLYPEQDNAAPPPAARDIPLVTGIVRARVNEFHAKLKKKKKAAAVAAEEAAVFFGAGDVDVKAPPPRLLRPPRAAGNKPPVVLYFTSLRGVRRTFEDCRAVRAILRCYRVRLDERDVSMHAAFKSELRDLLLAAGAGGEVGSPALPRVFVGGSGRRHELGGAEELLALHEAGELGRALGPGCHVGAGHVGGKCAACGEARFVLCGTCHGSCKVFVGDEGCGRRFAGFFRQCADCNENGLIRCPVCCY